VRLAALQSVVNTGSEGPPVSSSPLRRFEDSLRVPAARHRVAGASREVGCSSECCEHGLCRIIGFPAATSTSRFPARPGGSTSHVVPRSLARTGSSSRELRLLFRVRPPRTCPAHGCVERLPWGFGSPSRHQQRRSTCERAPTPTLRSVPGVSHALDGLLPPPPRGLVSSHSHVRDSPLRGLFPPPSRAASSTARALLSLIPIACRRVAATAPASVTSPPGPCSGGRSATSDGVFSSADVRSPLRLRSCGFFARLGKAFTLPPLVDFTTGSCV
jgi:hypothetical protein